MEKTQVINWIKKNKRQAIIVSLILLLALGLRLYRIADYMTYLGDEGRDVRIVRDLVMHGNLVFIGPQTSVGNMYLGPLYYYIVAPALFLSGLNPVGPAILNALLGTFTVFLLWYLGTKWFSKLAGNLSALLFAISPVAIIYSRSSWNPNPMPMFALLSVWGIYEVWKNHKYNLLPFIGLSFGAALQMHYLGLLLIPVLGLFWLLEYFNLRNKKSAAISIFLSKTFIGVFLFLLLMSPLFLFDYKHNWLNLHAFLQLIFSGQGSINSAGLIYRTQSVLSLIVKDLYFGRVVQNGWLILIPVFSTLYYFYQNRKIHAVQLISVWLLIAILGLSFYKNEVYIHYLGFIYPAVFLSIGAQISYFFKRGLVSKIISILAIFVLVFLSINGSPLRSEPNALYKRNLKIVDLIISESSHKPFNFGLIAKNNYDESYRYIFENKKSQMIRGEEKITDQLFVVCEDGDQCKPEGNSQYQIAIFGVAKVVAEWQVDYIKIYRLEHVR